MGNRKRRRKQRRRQQRADIRFRGRKRIRKPRALPGTRSQARTPQDWHEDGVYKLAVSAGFLVVMIGGVLVVFALGHGTTFWRLWPVTGAILALDLWLFVVGWLYIKKAKRLRRS